MDMGDKNGYSTEILLLACGVKAPMLFNIVFVLTRYFFLFEDSKNANILSTFLDTIITTMMIITKGLLVKKFVKMRRLLYDSMMEYLTLMNKVSVGVLILSREKINDGKSRKIKFCNKSAENLFKKPTDNNDWMLGADDLANQKFIPYRNFNDLEVSIRRNRKSH